MKKFIGEHWVYTLFIVFLGVFFISYIIYSLPYFSFLRGRSSFDIGQALIPYSPDNTYWRAILTGFLNTLYVATLCIIVSTLFGFFLSLGRLSKNILLSRLCSIYIEIFRNIPLLLVILLFYFLLLYTLPNIKNSYDWWGIFFFNQRGFYFPSFYCFSVFLLFIIGFLIFSYYFIRPYFSNFNKLFIFFTSLFIIIFFAIYCMLVPIQLPLLGKFNIVGGNRWSPEFLALFLGLSFYSSAFCAEIIRGGIISVNKGIVEAGKSLGLSSWQTKRQIILPIALRIIIPPLSISSISLFKNTSLAVAIGFPDFVSVTSTILNQTGKAVQIVLLWFIFYGFLSLFLSFLMNWFHKKFALVG